MPSHFVDLSQDSEDDCYIYPSKRHPPPPSPQKSPLKHAVRTPTIIRTSVAIRKHRPSSSSSSSVISILSPPRKIQTQITTFLHSPTKQEQKTINTMQQQTIKWEKTPKPVPIPWPMATSIVFEKSDLFVDDDEAPMPYPFDVSADEGTFDFPMEVDSRPGSPVPVLVTSSPPKFHRAAGYPQPKGSTGTTAAGPRKKLGVSKRGPPKKTPPSSRPRKVVRRELGLSDSEPAGRAVATGPKVGFTPVKKKKKKDVVLQTELKADRVDGGTAATLPMRQASEAHGDDLSPTVATPRGQQPERIICRAHADPDCNAVECISDFFDEYSPFHDTLPDDNAVPSNVQQPEMAKPLSLAVPPVAKAGDIRKLRRQHISLLLASDTLSPEIRRPYMSVTARKFLREVRTQREVWEKLFADSDGCLIHVGFTSKECVILGGCIHEYLEKNPNPTRKYPALCESGEYSEDLHNYLKTAFTGLSPDALARVFEHDIEYPMDQLPGRIRKDCTDFLVDATDVLPDPRDPFILVDLSAPKLPSRGVRRMLEELNLRGQPALRARMAHSMSLFQPVWRFENGASDILDIQWSADGSRFGMASATFSDGYNRAGNLMLGTAEPWKVKMLFRHAFRVRHQAIGNLEKFKWATVSCVRFSNTGSLFYSGSYDGSVKIWDGKTGQWIYSVPLKTEVMTMATNPSRDHLLAASTKDGTIHVIRLSDERDELGELYVNKAELHISKEDEKKQGLYASCLLFGNKRQPNWLISGYDTNNEGQAHGGLAIFDLETGKNVLGLIKGKRAYSTRHFDIAMHEEGTTLVAASFQRKYGTSPPTAIRVFDIRHINKPPIFLKSKQKDINRVTVSPCENYVTSSGTGGSTLVWDIRNPSATMNVLEHDESKLPLGPNVDLELNDTGVTFAQWSPYSHHFYTGSSDGIVKEWDVTASNPFLRDVAKVDTQIMSAAFSPSWDELIVGECSGTATLFSIKGDEGVAPIKVDVDWTQDPNMMSPDDDSIPVVAAAAAANVVVADSSVEEVVDEESGVQLARQLVAEGKVWIRDRYAWGADDNDNGDDDDDDDDYYNESEMLC